MTIISNGCFDREDLVDSIQKLKELASDLEGVLYGTGPSDKALAKAPVIDNWSLARREAQCLFGTFHNHPRLGEYVRNGVTSPLWLLNLDQQYARTYSRFYRLGKLNQLGRSHQ